MGIEHEPPKKTADILQPDFNPVRPPERTERLNVAALLNRLAEKEHDRPIELGDVVLRASEIWAKTSATDREAARALAREEAHGKESGEDIGVAIMELTETMREVDPVDAAALARAFMDIVHRDEAAT